MEGNSLLKAETIFRQFGHIVVSDDSGLEVQALNGAPGVYSARYAGEQKDDQQNNEKLLHELKGITNRNAQFRTVISLMSSNDTLQFEGIVEGAIAYEPKGDKVLVMTLFLSPMVQKTFAELTSNEKIKLVIEPMR